MSDRPLQMETAEVEKVFGKPISELIKVQENRKYLSKILTEKSLRKLMKMENVSMSESQLKIMKNWFIEYGHQPTTEELSQKTQRDVDKYLEAEQKIVDSFVKMEKLLISSKGTSYEAEDKKYVEEQYGKYKEFLGEEKFNELKARAKTQQKEEWMQKTRDDHTRLHKKEARLEKFNGKIGTATSEDRADLEDAIHDLKEDIQSTKDSIEKDYAKINPELAELRQEERDKVAAGVDPKIAQKERRKAVRSYYAKRSTSR